MVRAGNESRSASERVARGSSKSSGAALCLYWIASIDSTIVRVHQHGATLPRDTGGTVELQEGSEMNPLITRSDGSRGGLTIRRT